MPRNLLILGGTAEANDLARELARWADLRVISSLAGRTGNPRLPEGEVRIGGFGGEEGLAAYLRDNAVDAVVDCTHPFAARMGWNAAQGCAIAHVPLLRLERPAWIRQVGDLWDEVGEWSQAAALVGARAKRVLMAVGRQELEPFAALGHVWFLIRTVEAPDPAPPFASAEILLARGPFTTEAECELLTAHRIDTIVCKNSGGPADAKLSAARKLGLRVVIKSRPPRPDTLKAANVSQVLDWLR